MEYQICSRCKFRVLISKSICSTCGYSLVVAPGQAKSQQKSALAKTAPQTEVPATGFWGTVFGINPSANKPNETLPDEPAMGKV